MATDRMVVWLRQAMDDAEREAESAAEGAGSHHWAVGEEASCQCCVNLRNVDGGLLCTPDSRYVDFMAAHDPAAVLRRIAADRKILDAHPTTTEIVNPGYGEHVADFGCVTCHDWDGVTEGKGWCPTVRLLAEGWGWVEGAQC